MMEKVLVSLVRRPFGRDEMLNFLNLLQVIGLGVMIFSISYILRKRKDNKYDYLIILIFAVLLQNIGYLLLVFSPTKEAALQGLKVEYVGTSVIPYFYVMFVLKYLGKKYPNALKAVHLLISSLILVGTWNCENMYFYYTTIEFVDTGMFPHLVMGKGILYGIMLANVAWLYGISLFYAIRMLISGEVTDKRKRILFAFITASCIPVLALLSYAFGLVSNYDFTPLADMLVVSLLVIYSVKENVFDLVNLAKDQVFDIMDDAILIVDENYRLLESNAGAKKMFQELMNPENCSEDKRRKQIRSLFQGGEVHEFSMDDRCYQVRTYQFKDDDQKIHGGVALILDITKQKNDMKQLILLREEADSANRAKSNFLATVSHEIRTPMNAIVGMSDLIMEESVGRKVYYYACDIKAASDNLLRIIDEILDVSQMELGKMQLHPSEYDFPKMLEKIHVDAEEDAKKKGLNLKFNLEQSLPKHLYGDEKRVGQILWGLLDNAIKFTRKGKIEFILRAQKKNNNRVKIICKVIDTGIGIKKDQTRELFQNFQQIDSDMNRQNEGVGLGLAVSKRLAKMMGGDITIESEIGIGSIFTAELFQEIRDEWEEESKGKEVHGKESLKIPSFEAPEAHVLVVDDNKVNLKVAQKFLEAYALHVTLAESGRESINLVRQKRFHAIFMDYMMPEMDGVEATRLIRKEAGENGQEVPIIALTANVSDEAREMFANNGVFLFLVKPIDRKEMDSVLNEVIPEEMKREKNSSRTSTFLNVKSLSSDEIYSETPKKEAHPGKKSSEAPEDKKEFQIMKRVKKLREIDEAVVEERFGEHAEDYVELLGIYAEEGYEKIKLMQTAAEQMDAKNYGILVHGLKSASANIGAMSLSNRAKSHEMAAKSGNLEGIREDVARLLDEYANLLNLLKRIMKLNVSVQETDRKRELSKAQLKELLQSALMKIEDFHTKDALEDIRSIMNTYLLDAATDQLLKNAEKKIKIYDDEAAEDMIREYLKKL